MSLSFSTKPSLEDLMRQILAERGQAFEKSEQPIAASDALADLPPAPEEYLFSLPATFQPHPELAEKARQWFYRGKIPQGLVNGLLQEYCRHASEEPSMEEMEARAQETERLLRREWGDDFDRKIDSIRQLLHRMDETEEIHTLIEELGMDGNAWFLRSLASLAEQPSKGETA